MYPTSARFWCDPGYVLDGEPLRTCLSTGEWTSVEYFAVCEVRPAVDQTTSSISSPSVSELHLPSTLVGYWPLDGDGTDLSGNNLDGEMMNAEWVVGMNGDAMYLDGDDALVVRETGSGPLDVSNVLMVAWVMPSQYGKWPTTLPVLSFCATSTVLLPLRARS